MNQNDLLQFLNQLLQSWENETVEFKEVSNDCSTGKIGEYFSALANEANLRDREKAWLVFGINNRTRKISGTNYRSEHTHLQSLKMQIADNTEPSITFRNIFELQTECGRVFSSRYLLLLKEFLFRGMDTIIRERVKALYHWV